MRKLQPKVVGALYCGAVGVLLATACWLVALPPARLPRVGEADVQPAKDASAARWVLAAGNAGQLAQNLASYGYREVSSAATIAEFVDAESKPVALSAEALAAYGVVILQTGGRSSVFLNGKRVRVGEQLPGGVRLASLGPTHVWVEDGLGARHRIALQDMFTGASIEGEKK